MQSILKYICEHPNNHHELQSQILDDPPPVSTILHHRTSSHTSPDNNTRNKMNPPPSHPRPVSRPTNPTPRTTVSRTRPTSNIPHSHRAPPPGPPVPPQAPRPSRNRRPIDTTQTNFLSNLLQEKSVVPRASCGKTDDILGPPDAQSCPFAKAGLKVLGIGVGGYGELEGSVAWPVELYDHERIITIPTVSACVTL